MSVDWVVIAETGGRFSDFAPFVPGIDDKGRVVFEAALPDGGSFDGSIVTDLAANPVSATPTGFLGARLALADGRQLIVRTRISHG